MGRLACTPGLCSVSPLYLCQLSWGQHCPPPPQPLADSVVEHTLVRRSWGGECWLVSVCGQPWAKTRLAAAAAGPKTEAWAGPPGHRGPAVRTRPARGNNKSLCLSLPAWTSLLCPQSPRPRCCPFPCTAPLPTPPPPAALDPAPFHPGQVAPSWSKMGSSQFLLDGGLILGWT